MSRQVLEQLMRLLPCRLQQAPQVEEESASYLELHVRLLVRIRPFGASPMSRSGEASYVPAGGAKYVMAPTLISLAQPRICREIHGSSSQQRLPQATSHERRNSTLPPRTRRCLADTARCAATRRLARTKTEAFDANTKDVVYALVGLLLVNYNSREQCVVIHSKKWKPLHNVPCKITAIQAKMARCRV